MMFEWGGSIPQEAGKDIAVALDARLKKFAS
jgi:hypothetical protein